MNLKSITANEFSFRIIKFINGILGVMLDCNFLTHFSKGCRCLPLLYSLMLCCVVCVKGILTANKPGICTRNQISVHNVVHPYRLTRDMLAGMRVLQQLDDKFIVGVLLQEGRIHLKFDAERANNASSIIIITNTGINVKKYLEWLSLIQLFSLGLCISIDAVKGTRDP